MNRDDFLSPPASLESEQSVLGALLLDNEAINRIPDLGPEAFYSAQHAAIFRAIQALATAGQPFDTVTTWSWMHERGEDKDGMLLPRLGELAQFVPSAGNIRRYAEIMREKALSRQLMAAATEIHELAMQPLTSAEQVDKAQMLLAKLAAKKSRRDPQHIHESLAGYLLLLQELSEGKNPALRTGIGGLDKILNGGIRRGEVFVIGARPKHGKTALALAMARNMARDYAVLYLSQEMPVNQLMHRHTAAMGTIPLGRILAADASDTELWERVNEAAHRLGKLALVHDDQCSLSLLDIRRKAVKVKRDHGLDALFIDFLQLMQGGGEESRNRELDVIVNGIKQLAMDLGVAVVLMSQMSRKADEHYGRPTMTHLRDSGAIEAAADQIALLFTDWAHPMSKRHPGFKGYSELDIVAHRNGPQGLIPLEFVGEYQQIGDWMRELPSHKTESQQRGGGGL
jgi:replicative DNA helicase